MDRWSDCHRVGDIELLRAPIGGGKPTTTYVVTVFEKPFWRTVLTTKDKAEAQAAEQAMVQDDVKAQVETITPKPLKARR
ncbi:hypothetical protein [Mesorhizobium caraganae]|uniref:hypothetical protein n=1 Tax=Mesorhizobium caraganae TaxID=483206 RepID=UPI0033383ED0